MSISEFGADTVWRYGKSGQCYPFKVYKTDAYFHRRPAVYLPARQMFEPSGGLWPNTWFYLLYIGESDELIDRLNSHDHLQEFWDHGMTHVLVMDTFGTRAERLDIETDLRNNYPTPINRQGGDAQDGILRVARALMNSSALGATLSSSPSSSVARALAGRQLGEVSPHRGRGLLSAFE